MTQVMIEHLATRGYDVNRYQTQWVSDDRLVVPLFDFDGKLKGYQTYIKDAPKDHDNPLMMKYFTRMRGNGQLVWGTEVPLHHEPGKPIVVFITESVFKACALHKAGFNAWSILGSDISKSLRHQLLLMPYKFVCCGDDDKAGEKFSRTFKHGFTSKDLDELSLEEVTALASPFTY